MNMLQFQLFLGFLIDDAFQAALDAVDQERKQFFINGGDEYLRQVSHGGKSYLGKCLGERSDFQRLHAVEENICSIVSKLAPDYAFEGRSFLLFPAQMAG